MTPLPAQESLGSFLKFPVMDGNTYGIEGEELDRRIAQFSNRGAPFRILVPGDQMGDALMYPVIRLGAKRYQLQYAGLEVGICSASPRIWVQIRRLLPIGNKLLGWLMTDVVNVPDLYRMRGDHMDSSILRRSLAAPFPP